MYELFVDKTSKISRYIQRKTLYRVACKQRSRQELKLMQDTWMLEQSMHQAKKQQASWRKSGDGGGKRRSVSCERWVCDAHGGTCKTAGAKQDGLPPWREMK